MSDIPRLRAFSDTAYSGASIQRKELADWQPLMTPPDAELLPEQEMLVSRSRDLARNHGLAAAAFQAQIDNVVGTGLRLAADPNWRAMGKTREWAENWSRNVESLWRACADSVCFDASRQLTFHNMTELVLRSVQVSGEVFALPLWIEDSHSPFGTCFQLLEGDRISNPDYRHDTERLRGGIEIDPYGKPVAYHVRKAPAAGEDYWLSPGMYMMTGTWDRIPAETDWGRKRMLHCFIQDRVGQSRGKPILTPVLEQFKMFDHYQRTELQSSIVNSLVAGVIETPMDQASIAALMNDDPNGYLAMKNGWKTKLQGGAIIPLYPGDKFNSFTPSRPGTQYESFTMTQLRHIAAALNMPYELLCKDFTQTNYSSARAALLEAWRYFMSRRKWLAEHWAQEVYSLWLEEAVNKGMIEAPGFYENYWFYTKSKWIGPGRGWIDPVKEIQAAVVRMGAGITTLEMECAEQGLDWQDTLEQRAREFARMDELGITKYLNAFAAAEELGQQSGSSGEKGKEGGQGAATTGGVRGIGSEGEKSGEEYGE